MFLVLDPAVVSSHCPLLSAEAAEEYLPKGYMQVPKHSAWIPMEVNVAAFAAANGEIYKPELEQALQKCVDEGDRLHDETDWVEPQVEYDSWLNRRLAIALRGWGDWAVIRGADPRALSTLRETEILARWVCHTLQDRSKLLARRDRWCPALDEESARILGQKKHRSWDRRWKKAVADVAVRHRNLTTMSPWDIFPGKNEADLRYVDLLPVTRFADSMSFQRDVSISHWNVNDFKGFYERVTAVVRCNRGAGLVAEQV